MEEIRKKIYKEYDPYIGLKLLPEDIQGWSSNSPVFEEIIVELQPKIIVEVGTWKGASAIHMAKTCLKYYDDFEIICIDTFLGSVEHWTDQQHLILPNSVNGRPTIYEQFLSNVLHSGLMKHIIPFPIDSINGCEILKKLDIKADLVYVDAGHDYNSVRIDLYSFSQILRNGGYMLGDDWFHEPVRLAAIDALGVDNIIEKAHDKFLWIK
jgi:predicted O-methyltransferase YrrM